MFNEISDYTIGLWRQGRKTKKSPSEWIIGNAPCCIHNGETQDTRRRGGFKLDGAGEITYHCFNCNFITGFKPGRRLPYKFRNLLRWLGAGEGDVQRLIIDALRMQDMIGILPEEEKHEFTGNFVVYDLPEGAATFSEWATYYKMKNDEVPNNLVNAITYATSRNLNLENNDFYWTPNPINTQMDERLIIPFYWRKKLVGFTARLFGDKSSVAMPKYITQYDGNGYVYNLENLVEKSDFVLVMEGPIDALMINGVAVMSNSISKIQSRVIDSIGKKVIVIPDQNKAGYHMIKQARDNHWEVAYPEWEDDIEDVSQSVERYGTLFTLKTILNSIATSDLKIQLMQKQRRARIYDGGDY